MVRSFEAGAGTKVGGGQGQVDTVGTLYRTHQKGRWKITPNESDLGFARKRLRSSRKILPLSRWSHPLKEAFRLFLPSLQHQGMFPNVNVPMRF